MRRRKVAVVTTSRADYGLLRDLLEGLSRERSIQLQLVVSGTHLSRQFGLTRNEIRADGFPIAAAVKMISADDSDAGAARTLSRGLSGMSDAFGRLRPDLVVVLGDRFELLAVCGAAVARRIPIAHIHGGESTDGVIDEQVRHAVTKLAHLHFTAAAPYRRRVIQMGEDPRRVFLSGAPGLERIARLRPWPLEALAERLGMPLSEPFALVTYHPDASPAGLAGLDAALTALERSGLRAVFTFANADPGGRAINARIRRYQRRHPRAAAAVPSLGSDGYLSLMRRAAVVYGNSSSGILEAPSMRVPTVNIGERQAGRLRAPSVLDCAPTAAAAGRALRTALSPAFRSSRCRGKSPYLGGPVAARIIRVLKSYPLPGGLIPKPFIDL